MLANRPPRPLTIWNKLGYGLGDTASNLVWRTMMVFLPIFYTDVFKLSAIDVGVLLLVCRYFDGVTDLGMGIVADRTVTRWGKYRPWILWTALPFGVATILTFATPDLGYNGRLTYAYLTYCTLILVFTANNIPYAALTGAMSDDPVERTSLSSWRFGCAFLGALIAQVMVIYLVSYFGQGDSIRGYKYTMTLLAGISTLLFFITFLATKERHVAVPVRSAWWTDLKDLFRSKSWLVLFAVGLLMILCAALRNGVIMYYFKYYVANLGLAAAFMACSLIASMVGAIVAKPLAARFGKKRTMAGSLLLAAAASLGLYFSGPGDLVAIFVLGSATDLALGPPIVLFFAMLADTADHYEWQHRRQATGLVFSAGTVAIKFSAGAAGALTGVVLAGFGYVANADQSPQVLTGIRLLLTIFPAIAAIVAVLMLYFYRLDEAALEPIQKELNRRRDGGTSTVLPQI